VFIHVGEKKSFESQKQTWKKQHFRGDIKVTQKVLKATEDISH